MGGESRASGVTMVRRIAMAAAVVLGLGGCATSGGASGRVTPAPQIHSRPLAWTAPTARETADLEAARPAPAPVRTPPVAQGQASTPAGRRPTSPQPSARTLPPHRAPAPLPASAEQDQGEHEVALVSAKPAKGAAAKRPSRGRRIAASATRLVGLETLTGVTSQVPDDCTGVPRYVYRKYGIDLMDVEGRPGENGVTLIHRRARKAGALHKRTPRPGDLVFFRETYDRNRDGLRNDGLTHVGVVEKVERDGTVVFVHRGSKGVARARMNLRSPAVRAVEGRVLNDYIRARSDTSRAYLTGELFAGYASPDRL